MVPTHVRRLKRLVLLITVSGLTAWSANRLRNPGVGEKPLLDSSSQLIDGLVVSTPDLDFGEAADVDVLVWKLPIRNQASKEITIVGFRPTCGCLEAMPPSLTIPPSAQRDVTLKLDLGKTRGTEPNRPSFPFRVDLSPIIKPAIPGTSVRPWVVKGIVKRRVILNANAIDFGDLPRLRQSPVSRKLLARVHVPS
jgi:hypothetical protein